MNRWMNYIKVKMFLSRNVEFLNLLDFGRNNMNKYNFYIVCDVGFYDFLDRFFKLYIVLKKLYAMGYQDTNSVYIDCYCLDVDGLSIQYKSCMYIGTIIVSNLLVYRDLKILRDYIWYQMDQMGYLITFSQLKTQRFVFVIRIRPNLMNSAICRARFQDSTLGDTDFKLIGILCNDYIGEFSDIKELESKVFIVFTLLDDFGYYVVMRYNKGVFVRDFIKVLNIVWNRLKKSKNKKIYSSVMVKKK